MIELDVTLGDKRLRLGIGTLGWEERQSISSETRVEAHQARHERDLDLENAYRDSMLFTAGWSAMIVVVGAILVFAAAVLRARPGTNWWLAKNLDFGLDSTDATVVVVGLFTVVAALSIALASMPTVDEQTDPRRAAPLMAWGSITAAISPAAAALALAAAMSQLFTKTSAVETAFLIAVALLGILLASAMRTWSGKDRIRITSAVARRDTWRSELLRLKSAGARAQTTFQFVRSAVGFALVLLLADALGLTVASVVEHWRTGFWTGRVYIVDAGLLALWSAVACLVQFSLLVQRSLATRASTVAMRWSGSIILVCGTGFVWLISVAIPLVYRPTFAQVWFATDIFIPLIGTCVAWRFAHARPRGPAAFSFHFRAARSALLMREAQASLLTSSFRWP